jgi:endonuclease YncB( thermonuclease family)
MKLPKTFKNISLLLVICFLSVGCPLGDKNKRQVLKVLGPQELRVAWEKGSVAKLEKMEKVRFFGVNIPNTLPGRGEAMQLLKDLLEGKEATIFADDPNAMSRDANGSIFAHVIIDDLHINVELVRSGFSKYTQHKSNSQYNAQFIQAQKEAEEAEIGIWNPDYIKKMQERARWGW